MDFDTKAIHGDGKCIYEGAVSFPIFQTSTYDGGKEFSYSRCENPTRKALEKEAAALENAEYAFAFSSGLAAINALFSILKSGDRVIVSDDLYGGTYRLIEKIFSKYGIEFVFCDLSDNETAEKEISKGADLLLAESPTNPTMKIADLRFLSSVCRKGKTVFAVDNTFLSPYFQNPLDLGADAVIHSATKFISGHHDTISGLIATNRKDLAEKFSLILKTLGNALSPFDCFLTLRGMKTLPLRMKKHEENAKAAAEFLEKRNDIEKVYYPGLESHKGHELCKSQSRGFGGVVSFSVKDINKIEKLKNGGKFIRYAESLGGPCTLITYPLTQTHASVPYKMREKMGITDRLFRLSAGLESKEDIIKDLEYMLS